MDSTKVTVKIIDVIAQNHIYFELPYGTFYAYPIFKIGLKFNYWWVDKKLDEPSNNYVFCCLMFNKEDGAFY